MLDRLAVGSVAGACVGIALVTVGAGARWLFVALLLGWSIALAIPSPKD